MKWTWGRVNAGWLLHVRVSLRREGACRESSCISPHPTSPMAFRPWHFLVWIWALPAAKKTIQERYQAKPLCVCVPFSFLELNNFGVQIRVYVCACARSSQTELVCLASQSGRWRVEGKIHGFFISAFYVTNFGVGSKDDPTWKTLSRWWNYWIRVKMFSFKMILALFMNQLDNCLSFAYVLLGSCKKFILLLKIKHTHFCDTC